MKQVQLTLIVLVTLFVIDVGAGGIPTPKSCLNYLKDMALSRFKAGLEKTEVMTEFRGAVERIKEQFEAAAEQGLFNPSDDTEASKYYYQLAVAEVKRLRESGKIAQEMSQVGSQPISEGYACKRVDQIDDDAEYDMMDMDLEDTGVDSLSLENQLNELNLQLESEMGWQMTPEARQAMHAKAKELAREVLQNEVRDLALAALTAFISGGGVGGAVLPVWQIVSGSLKLKVVKYFMQMVLDVLSSYLGHPIELKA